MLTFINQTHFFPVGYGPPLLKLGEVIVLLSPAAKVIIPGPHSETQIKFTSAENIKRVSAVNKYFKVLYIIFYFL
jgi:hypothetical protein